jgi:hypothetical protein
MIANPDPKSMAMRLRSLLADAGRPLTHAQALEIVAAQLGFRDWNTCAAALEHGHQPVTIPVLRTFPGGEADRFYLEFLGFSQDWEHRFEPHLPLYRQVSREGCVLHLSEHHGDATPGAAVRINVPDVWQLQDRLARRTEYPLKIGTEKQDWADELLIPDPFGNRLIFSTATR